MDDGRTTPVTRRRPRGRTPLWVGAAIVLVAGAGTAGALGLGGDGGTGSDAKVPRTDRTVQVARGTLTEQKEIDGTLGHGPEVPFHVRAEGTVTWLPETGARVTRGKAVLRVDDRPVTLLYGSLPMYRDLAVRQRAAEPQTDADGGAKATDDPAPTPAPQPSSSVVPLRGMDVKQFESNLSALGYTGFTVDEEYTGLTATAVKRWQRDLGLPQTGRVAIGDIVYAPGAVRVARADAQVGAEATGNPVTYSSTSRMVSLEAPAADLGWAQRGTEVTVELPDGRPAKAEVARVGKDAAAVSGVGGGGAEGGNTDGSTGGEATVPVVVAFDDQKAVGRLESGPVTVRYVVKEDRNVLKVPVAALVALAEGGYALEPAGTAGTFVPVRTGLFADGMVAVSGPGVRGGLKVRIPE
ncbi:peptidoglycan-binding protein [Streptomyces sp. NPDC005775]|uniref:peptidoglycan-binding protein n=1 Tax=unclassified Streptomyces TaxID=2593676 RepID=UPI0033C48145